MRVIAGSLRGRRLATFKGRDVRPTPDRVREALFSILQSRLGGFGNCRVLDLFAGSGALAIEALSRGAIKASLVEKAPDSIKIIKQNLQQCHLSEKVELFNRDVLNTLSSFQKGSFDVIFLDPPYGQGLAKEAIEQIARCNLLHEKGIVCAETGTDEDLPEIEGRLQRIDQRRYGSVMISFYSY